jgi:DNA/RNA-binding domain of Phe-tRNA-synthetase-like protein
MNRISNWLGLRDAQARQAETERLRNHPVAVAWRENAARLQADRQAAAPKAEAEVPDPEPEIEA